MAKIEKISLEELSSVTQSSLADYLSIDRQRLKRTLAQLGIPPSTRQRPWDAPTFRRLLSSMFLAAEQRFMDEETEPDAPVSGGGDTKDAIDEERLRKLRLENDRIAGELLPRDQVLRETASVLARVRSAVIDAGESSAAAHGASAEARADLTMTLRRAMNEAAVTLAEDAEVGPGDGGEDGEGGGIEPPRQ